MMLTSIPSFIDPKGLTINRTGSSNKDGHTIELTAADREGDTITLSHWTQDVGSACVVPKEKLSVNYQEQSKDPVKPEEVGSEEAYPLYRALKKAQRADNLDDTIIGYLLADLRKVGGIGGAC